MREYAALQALRRGEAIEVSGRRVAAIPGEIGVGDLYIGERNTGPRLLTAKRIVGPGEGPDGYGGWIQPVEPAYPYDTSECVKVVEL